MLAPGAFRRCSATLAIALLAAGCRPVHYRMQAAAGLAPDRLAVATPSTAFFGVRSLLWGVDGEQAGRFTLMREVELPPGPHLLNVGYEEPGFFAQSHSIGTTPVCLVAEPGRRYEIRSRSVPNGHFFQPDAHWRPWVIDQATGEVVSSFPAQLNDPQNALPATLEVLSLHACWGRGTLDPQAAPRAAVAALAREIGSDGDAVVCHGERATLPAGDATPREWTARFAAARATIQPCLRPAERDTVAAYERDPAVVRHRRHRRGAPSRRAHARPRRPADRGGVDAGRRRRRAAAALGASRGRRGAGAGRGGAARRDERTAVRAW
jgi:hypothetical protein